MGKDGLLLWGRMAYCCEEGWPTTVGKGDLLLWRRMAYCSGEGWPTAVVGLCRQPQESQAAGPQVRL